MEPDEVMLPVVFIDVVPVITALVMVPDVITGLVRLLFSRVSDAPSVTTIPEAGNVAVELTPVPPKVVASAPDVMFAAESAGISAGASEAPVVTRPLASTVTFV